MRAAVLLCWLVCVSLYVRGQSCDCPAVTTCNTCSGGLLSLTLRYTGSTPQTITAADLINTVFSGVVNPNATFSFVGSIPNEKFVGPEVLLTVNGVSDATIPSVCGSVFVGNVYGSFIIIAASSKTGGALCCSAGSTETTPPQITGCPTDLTVDLPPSACSVAGGWTPPVATDNCAVSSFSGTHDPTDLFNIGTTNVTYTAIDSYGNTSSCSFNVTVVDNSAPVITSCPGEITIEASGSCQSVVSWVEPGASDNCSASLTTTRTSGSTFPFGTTAVTYTATDPSGNATTCSFNVIVVDTTAPVITNCPTDITVEATASCQSVASWAELNATDNCSANMTTSHTPGSTFPFGTTAVTYTATDPSGNATTCSFNVIVVDTTAPVITNCPTDITVEASGSCQSVVSWVEPGASDNCSASLTTTRTSGSTFPFGTTAVTYTATDPTGNATTCSFNVIVVDTTAPVITNCTTDITVEATASCQSVVSWAEPNATDNCSANMTTSHTPGSTFPFGTTAVTYTASDQTGNVSTCSFNVVVVDTTAPVITNCPTDITVEAEGSCVSVVSWAEPGASDNCSATLTTTRTSGSTFPFGTTAVTYTATDPTGNATICSFNVIVVDTTAPVITNCPTEITVEADGSCQGVVSWAAPGASDNCSANMTSSHAPGSTFPLGTTAVTYTASDPSGNVSTCSFNIIVEDSTAPLLAGCPADINITTTTCDAVGTWTPPVSSDNCSSAVVASHQPGDTFQAGSTTVTYTATDVGGNSSTCSFKVIVNNGSAPAIRDCPGNITLHTFDDEIPVTWEPPQATPVCGNLAVNASHVPDTRFNPGVTEVTYEFVDGTGNKSVCSFNVTVIKDELSFEVSKVVTPNGDGVNDTWWMTDIEKFTDNSVVVVDRWGNRMYSSSGYDNVNVQWAGQGPSGSRVPVGTYFYTIEARVKDTVIRYTGFVEVLY